MTLGIVPSNLVLFPGVQFQLQILEPRFRQLIIQCRDRGSEFGVNLTEAGIVHTIGCTAIVSSLMNSSSDQAMTVVVEGKRRYAILDVMSNTEQLCVSQVQILYDEPETTDASLLVECVTLYNQVITTVFGNSEPFDPESLGSRSAAFLMAPKCGLSNQQKQTLLELDSENERLQMLQQILAETLPEIQRVETQRQLIMRDGYIIK